MTEPAETTVVAAAAAGTTPDESYSPLEEILILKTSVSVWQEHLKSSFRHAKSRFGDVVWEVNKSIGKERDHNENPVEIWGHKAILYARVPAAYRDQYFPRKDGSGTSPLPYATVSGSVPPKWQEELLATDPEPFDSSHASCLLRLSVSKFDEQSLTRVLRGFYAENKGPKEKAPLSDVAESNPAVKRLLTGLQADLLFAWRARLNSDVRIVVPQPEEDPPVYVFWSHRFLLASRSPYFKGVLAKCAIAEKEGPASDEVLTLALPTPTFTPPGFFFILGFIYTGTLNYFNRTYDLSTAFSIFKGSRYLDIATLTAEIRVRFVEEMMHGLFHAFATDEEYERLVGQKWNGMTKAGGCSCRQCSRRIPRVLEFALEEDAMDDVILRGVRRASVALFGEGWCTPEFGGLSRSSKEYVMKDIKVLATAINVFPLLFKAEMALTQLETMDNADNDLSITDMVVDVRDALDQVLFTDPDSCFESEEWMRVMKDCISDNEDRKNQAGSELGWVLKALSRCLDDHHARALYHSLGQLLVPSRVSESFHLSPSSLRTRIEEAIGGLSAIMIDPSSGLSRTYSTPQLEPQPISTIYSTRSRSSSTSSIYSSFSAQGSTFNIEELDPSYRAYPANLDAANISLYSYPSSNTISTDYGLFYTRMAPSMDSIGNASSDEE